MMESLAKFKEITDKEEMIKDLEEKESATNNWFVFGEESFCKICDKINSTLIPTSKFRNIYGLGNFGVVSLKGRARDCSNTGIYKCRIWISKGSGLH